MKGPKLLRWAVWLVLAALLVWGIRSAPLEEMWVTLRGTHPLALMALAAFNLGIFALFNLRIWLLLRTLGYRRAFLPLLAYRLAAFGVSYFTPGAQFGGEPVQVLLLERREKISRADAVAVVALDRLFDLLGNFAFLSIGIILAAQMKTLSSWGSSSVFMVIAVLLGLPVIYLALLGWGYAPLSRLTAGILSQRKGKGRLGQAQPFLKAMEGRISGLLQGHPRGALLAFLLSGLLWPLMLGEYWLMFQFLSVPLNPVQAITALTAARLAFLMPVPGGLGALEAGQVLAMQALGLPAAVGLTASLLIRARDLSLGGIGLWLAGWLLKSSDPNPILPRVDLEERKEDEYSNRPSTGEEQTGLDLVRHSTADSDYRRDSFFTAFPQSYLHSERTGIPVLPGGLLSADPVPSETASPDSLGLYRVYPGDHSGLGGYWRKVLARRRARIRYQGD